MDNLKIRVNTPEERYEAAQNFIVEKYGPERANSLSSVIFRALKIAAGLNPLPSTTQPENLTHWHDFAADRRSAQAIAEADRVATGRKELNDILKTKNETL